MSKFYFGTVKRIDLNAEELEINATLCGAPTACDPGAADACLSGTLKYCNASTCSWTPYFPTQTC